MDGVALDEKADTGGDADGLAREGRCGQGEEGVHGVPVVLRQLGAARPGRLPAGRDVGVLGDPQRLEAQLLDGGRELGHRDRVLGREYRYPELHISNRRGTTLSPLRRGDGR